MMVIKPDRERRISIAGVLDPVRRPVDIDQSRTGFAALRTLRIYRFDKDSVIEGHAEEDEVYIVVLTGSIELTIDAAAPEHGLGPATLSAPQGLESTLCVAYLPPGASYRLVAKTQADVAYARATPAGVRLPQWFSCFKQAEAAGVSTLFEDSGHAERLRMQLLRVDAGDAGVSFSPSQASDAGCELLLHLRHVAPAASILVRTASRARAERIDSWDTLALSPGEHAVLQFSPCSSALLFAVMAYG